MSSYRVWSGYLHLPNAATTKEPKKKNYDPQEQRSRARQYIFLCARLPFQYFLSNTLPLRTCQSSKEKRKTLLFPLSTKAKRKRCLWRSLLPPPNFLTVEFQARSLNPSYRPGSQAKTPLLFSFSSLSPNQRCVSRQGCTYYRHCAKVHGFPKKERGKQIRLGI